MYRAISLYKTPNKPDDKITIPLIKSTFLTPAFGNRMQLRAGLKVSASMSDRNISAGLASPDPARMQQ